MTPQELKASILQLAIQGKLVPQNPDEGTGEELYQHIQSEKQRLIKAGKIKKEKPLPEIAEDEIPFDIPDSWKWYRLGELFNIVNGFTPLKSNSEFWEDGDIPWFTIEDVHCQGHFITATKKFITRKALSKNTERIVPANTVLLCCTASVGEYAYTKIPLTTNQQFNAFVLKEHYQNAVYPLYVFEYAKTLKGTLIDRAGKTTFNFVSVGKLSNMLISLPPLAEQKRIVAKIEELLPLIDRYEQAWSKLEDFNKRFPVDMQKSILQMAIQGKLVPQLPEEGTGEELFQQIQAEKQHLVKAGTIKKEKPLPEITEDAIPFDIPDSWKWVHLQSLCSLIGDIDHNMPKAVDPKQGVLFLSAKDLLDDGTINYTDNVKYISQNDFERLSRKALPRRNDIIYSRIGAALGKARVVESDVTFLVSYSCCVIRPLFVDVKFLRYYLESPLILAHSVKARQSIGVPDLGMGEIKKYLVALPPLAEQKRIVAKLEEILPLCERLK